MPPPLPLRILIVDDESENIKALERTLKPKFDIQSTGNPQEALSLVEKHEYAVVISDQRMPGMLGTDLLASIAKMKPLITRVILTGHTEVKEMLDAINRAQIYRYITKPWDNQELIGIIQQAADHHVLLKKNTELVEELRTLNKNLENLVTRRTAELQQANEKLAEQAMTDPLTKILNRRGFFNRFNDLI
jgi:DNA-binding NtrC family response regulator